MVAYRFSNSSLLSCLCTWRCIFAGIENDKPLDVIVWSIGSHIKELQNARLHEMDQYQVGRPPEKLHQVSLSHAVFQFEVWTFAKKYLITVEILNPWVCVGDKDYFNVVIFLQRPFICSVDDCSASYRRKDHLTRHILQHQGKLFKCPVENCNLEFVFPSNIKRHTEKFHNDADNESPASSVGGQKQHVCQEVGCGKVFKFASQLQKHADSHGKVVFFFMLLRFFLSCILCLKWINQVGMWIMLLLIRVLGICLLLIFWVLIFAVKPDSIEAFCAEPGCMKYFTNEQCLRAHVQTCHQKIDCEICGSKQLRKNMKRHLRTHDGGESSSTRIKCDFEGCHQTFSTVSCCNL